MMKKLLTIFDKAAKSHKKRKNEKQY